MNFQRYITLSVFYILVVGAFAHYQTQEMFTIKLNNTIFPSYYISFLVILPIFVFFVFSLFHFSFASIKSFFKEKTFNKDVQNLHKNLNARLLGNKGEAIISNKELKKISNFLDNLSFTFKENKKYYSDIELLENTLEDIVKVYNGEYIENIEKKYSLNTSNDIYKKNTFNRFNSQAKFYIEVLNSQSKFSYDIVEYAITRAIENNNFTLVKNELKDMNVNMDIAISILKSHKEKDNTLTNDDYLLLLKKAKLNSSSYIKLIKEVKNSFEPNELISLFDKLSSENENTTKAYIYILLDFEMISEAKELLSSIDANENDDYAKIFAYLDAKDANVTCNISDFIK